MKMFFIKFGTQFREIYPNTYSSLISKGLRETGTFFLSHGHIFHGKRGTRGSVSCLFCTLFDCSCVSHIPTSCSQHTNQLMSYRIDMVELQGVFEIIPIDDSNILLVDEN